MSGETEAEVSGWTVDTLRAHILRLMAEKDVRDEQRFQALQRAIEKAENGVKDRFESVNEFRAQLGDQARTFLPRQEYDRAHEDLVERVDQMRASTEAHLRTLDDHVRGFSARRGGLVEAWGYVVGALGIVVAVASVIIASR